jgi:hypothetical protein
LDITSGIGHFRDPNLPIGDRILDAQAAIVAFTLYAYVLAALFVERRHHGAVLEESETRLQEALTAGAVTAFEWNPRNGLSQRSKNAAQILGLGPQQTFSAAQFLARVHPDDRARFKAIIDGSESTARLIQSPFVSFARTGGKCGLRKHQGRNLTRPGASYASRA